jgi:hypothetical protein
MGLSREGYLFYFFGWLFGLQAAVRDILDLDCRCGIIDVFLVARKIIGGGGKEEEGERRRKIGEKEKKRK